MSMLAHICFTLIIYEQFNFCRFRASAYTNVDRLCAVFLYNNCCFHKFIETCTSIEIDSIYIYLRSELMQPYYFRPIRQTAPPAVNLAWKLKPFLSCDLFTLPFLPFVSKWGHGSPVSWTSFLPIFSLLCPSGLD